LILSVNEPPPTLEPQTRPLPDLLPDEILAEFENGISIEEFLIRNNGPIPNALLPYADLPVTVVVQLEEPSLIGLMTQEGYSFRGPFDQTAYMNQLEQQQTDIFGQIMAITSEVTQIGDSFTKVLNGFMLRVPASSIAAIRALDGVKSVTRAPEHRPNLSASVPLINADDVWTYGDGYTGEGVTVAVIDTGIDYTHAMFDGPGTPADYANNDPDVIEPGTFPTMKVIGGYDFAGTDYDAGNNPIPVPDDDPLDEYGHGTHVASIAAGIDAGFGSGVAPDASLYALKIFGKQGSTSLTLHAIEWAMDPLGLGHVAEPVDVINMSLGSDFGPADENDPELIAVDMASAIGVTVVASAGNAGNSSYIVGSPSVADSAISVAASTTGFETSPYLEYNDGGVKYIPYTTSYNPFTTNIVADVFDVATIAGTTATLCDISGVTGTPLTDYIALISRGDCSFTDKINNAEALGAVAALIYNNTTGIINMDTTGSTLPAGSLTMANGNILVGLAPLKISVGPDTSVMTFPSDLPPDSIADFSSRGPRGFDSMLKPEITAPGGSIFAAEMGGGSTGVSMGGTSMAAPHIAGVAALLKDAHPDWSPLYIKAAMMNSAVDLTDGAGKQIPRQGAGRVDALAAVDSPGVAYADPELVSLNWGVLEVFDTFEDTRVITLSNLGDDDATIPVTVVFTSPNPGATLTPEADTVFVPAHKQVGFEVTLSLTAADLLNGFGYQEEYYGFVSFGGQRVPFYFVPRSYPQITELETETRFEVNSFGYVMLEHSGPIPSSTWGYPVTLTSDNDPDVLDAGDLRYVGMDYGGYDSYTDSDIFIPAFAMWGPVHTNQPYFSEVDLYIDADSDGAPETVNFNYNYGWLSGADDDNTWIVVQVDFTDGMLYMGSPYGIYADFNSGIQEWYLPATFNYIVDSFDYEVVSFDYNGTADPAGTARFAMSTALIWDAIDPFNEVFPLLFAVFDWDVYHYDDIQGIMLVDYYGRPGIGQAYYWPLDVYITHLMPLFMK